MSNFKLFTICMVFFLALFGCDVKTDNPMIISDSSSVVKANNNTNVDKPQANNTIRFDSTKDKVFPCLDRDFSVDSMTVDGNKILFHVTNVSTEKIYTFKLSKIQLRLIKDGKPTATRSQMTEARVEGDKLVPLEVFDAIYPGESAVVIQEMPSAFTKCEDYVLSYDVTCRYTEAQHVDLNKIIACTTTDK